MSTISQSATRLLIRAWRLESIWSPSDLIASPYDVAKLLGDTVETVEDHYAPFVRELRERARRIMECGEGLEITGTQQAQQKIETKRIQ